MAFYKQEIIPSISHTGEFLEAAARGASCVLLSQSDMEELVKVQKVCRRMPHVQLMIHVDILKGLSETAEAVAFLAAYIRPSAIISANPSVIAAAKKHGIPAIQRCFIFDEESLGRSLRMVEHGAPDYIQIMPGLMPEMIRYMIKKTGRPVLTGGLIRTQEEVEAALRAGALAVTTSHKELWEKMTDSTAADEK
jgi:glycerol uptake operon antiterminator